MDINYELYKVFYQVASTLNFSEASRKLYISQSAVSQSIKALEQKLGHKLFIRSTKRVSLTPEGETLLNHIAPAIRMIHSAETLIMDKDTLNGQIRIGASDTICRYFLIQQLNRFHTEYPNVNIKIINKPTTACMELLKQDLVDLVIVNTPLEHLDKFSYSKVIKEFQDVFVVNPKYFNISGSTLTLTQLQKLPLITLERNTTSCQFLLHQLKKLGYLIKPNTELNSNDLVLDLTTIGLGIGFLPDYMISEKSSELKVLNLDFELPKRQLILVSNTENSMIVQTFSNYFSPQTHHSSTASGR